MAAALFTVGERVRTGAVGPVARAVTVGTIQLVYRYVDLYDVQFDGYPFPRLMRGRELERVAAVP